MKKPKSKERPSEVNVKTDNISPPEFCNDEEIIQTTLRELENKLTAEQYAIFKKHILAIKDKFYEETVYYFNEGIKLGRQMGKKR